MACRVSMRRALMLQARQCPTARLSVRPVSLSASFSTSAPRAAPPPPPPPAAAKPAAAATSAAAAGSTVECVPAAKEAPKSSCPAGTVLSGLNYFKGKTDPVALSDEEYPAWLWNCLDVMKKATTAEEDDAGDEFSKSKKQRRMASKRQRELETQVLESGNMAALAPKIPLQNQTINLDAGTGGIDDLESALLAAEKRLELRVAMRKERRAKIKESNYLRSM